MGTFFVSVAGVQVHSNSFSTKTTTKHFIINTSVGLYKLTENHAKSITLTYSDADMVCCFQTTTSNLHIFLLYPDSDIGLCSVKNVPMKFIFLTHLFVTRFYVGSKERIFFGSIAISSQRSTNIGMRMSGSTDQFLIYPI